MFCISFSENKTGTGSQQKNTLFFRLRHYKSLRQGFSLSRGERYTAFCIRAGHQKVNLSFPPGTPAEGLQSNNMYIVLQCTPLSSAFKGKIKYHDAKFKKNLVYQKSSELCSLTNTSTHGVAYMIICVPERDIKGRDK